METKVCKKCGRTLPVSDFSKAGRGGGYRNVCKECHQNKMSEKRKETKEIRIENERLRRKLEDAKNIKIVDFDARDLILELKRRGYEGTLTYTKVYNIDVTNFE